MKKGRLNKKGFLLFLIIIFFFVLLLISGFKIISYLNDNKKNRNIQKEQQNLIKVIEHDDEGKKNEYDVDFESLKEQNPDTIAYLKVKQTNIDYIVVHAEDNDYYLNHNFSKDRNVSGWIFSDYHNKFDGTDKNIVIFGHNTHDGSMFGTLKNTLNEDWQTNEDNLKIILVTLEDTYYYQVFSTYVIVPEDYYINTKFNSDEEYLQFLHTIKNRSNYDYNVDLNSDDEILTLSTCVGNGSKRVVLHAVKLKNL